MRSWLRRRAFRTPLDVMGHTAHATDEGALIPWPVMRELLEGIEQTRSELQALHDEMKRWHNQIPDGQERVESVRRRHDDAVAGLERMAASSSDARCGDAPLD